MPTLIIPWSGRVLHHWNCTYCVHRLKISTGARRGAKEFERCALSELLIPAPNGPGTRFCESYQQAGCECERCSLSNL